MKKTISLLAGMLVLASSAFGAGLVNPPLSAVGGGGNVNAITIPVAAVDSYIVSNTKGLCDGQYWPYGKTNGVLNVYSNHLAGGTIYLVQDIGNSLWALKTSPVGFGAGGTDYFDNGLNGYQSSADAPFFGGWENSSSAATNVVVVPVITTSQVTTLSPNCGYPVREYWMALTNAIEIERQYYFTNKAFVAGDLNTTFGHSPFTGGPLSSLFNICLGEGYTAAFYHGDCEENMRGCIDQYSNTNIWQIASNMNARTTFGVVADQLNPDSSFGLRNTQNITAWGFVDFVYLLWKKTDDIMAFRQFETGCSNAMGVWNIYNTNTLCALSNHLVFSKTTSDVEAPELFADVGYNPISSIYRFRALHEMYEMLSANGELTAATNYLTEMAQTTTNIVNYFWDSNLGFLYKTNVPSHGTTHISLVGPSAMAVAFGALPSNIAATIVTNLVSNFSNGSICYRGSVNYYKTNGLVPFECLAHGFFLPYMCQALDTVRPDLSASLCLDWATLTVGYGSPGDIGGINWYYRQGAGEAKVEHYGTAFFPGLGYLRTKAAGQ